MLLDKISIYFFLFCPAIFVNLFIFWNSSRFHSYMDGFLWVPVRDCVQLVVAITHSYAYSTNTSVVRQHWNISCARPWTINHIHRYFYSISLVCVMSKFPAAPHHYNIARVMLNVLHYAINKYIMGLLFGWCLLAGLWGLYHHMYFGYVCIWSQKDALTFTWTHKR